MSFFGGGTDYPVWFREHGGAVLATTIDRYCYITCRQLPPFFEHKSRVVYAQTENVSSNHDIQHPAVRGVLQLLNVETGIEIHHDADLQARAGLGSSSAFTVGFLHAVWALQGKMFRGLRTEGIDTIVGEFERLTGPRTDDELAVVALPMSLLVSASEHLAEWVYPHVPIEQPVSPFLTRRRIPDQVLRQRGGRARCAYKRTASLSAGGPVTRGLLPTVSLGRRVPIR